MIGMSTNIVERLRLSHEQMEWPILEEAADEIERLHRVLSDKKSIRDRFRAQDAGMMGDPLIRYFMAIIFVSFMAFGFGVGLWIG